MNPLIPAVYAHGHIGEGAATSNFFFQHYQPGITVSGSLMVIAIAIAVGTAIILFSQQRKAKKTSTIQAWAWVYATMFYITTSLTYIPGLADEAGNFVGLFKLDLIDDLLHFASGLWATFAAWHSTRQAALYFKVFGAIYGLDGVLGLLTERGYLDGGIFWSERVGLSLPTLIGANLPHILIGSIALYVGFILAKEPRSKTPR